MSNAQQAYQELVSLTRDHLTQNRYPSRIVADRGTWEHFGRPTVRQAQPTVAPAPVALPPPPKLEPAKPEVIVQPVAAPPPTPTPRKAAPPTIVRETLPTQPTTDFEEVGKLVEEAAPRIAIRRQPPDDIAAQRLANRWQHRAAIPQVAVVCWNDRSRWHPFLANVTKAIDLTLGPSAIVTVEELERTMSWDEFIQTPHLKWVLTSPKLIHGHSELQHLYREADDRAFLGQVPILLLPDIAECTQDPSAKANFWAQIRKEAGWIDLERVS